MWSHQNKIPLIVNSRLTKVLNESDLTPEKREEIYYRILFDLENGNTLINSELKKYIDLATIGLCDDMCDRDICLVQNSSSSRIILSDDEKLERDIQFIQQFLDDGVPLNEILDYLDFICDRAIYCGYADYRTNENERQKFRDLICSVYSSISR